MYIFFSISMKNSIKSITYVGSGAMDNVLLCKIANKIRDIGAEYINFYFFPYIIVVFTGLGMCHPTPTRYYVCTLPERGILDC